MSPAHSSRVFTPHSMSPTKTHGATVFQRAERAVTPPLTIATSPEDLNDSGLLPTEEEASYEYHGPGSFISFCSNACVEWTCEKTGVQDFVALTKTLSLNISQHLKVGPGISHRQVPEPDEATAWRCVNAYFDESRDVVFGIVCRTVFESRLRAHFKNDQQCLLEQDSSWYALRNAVYATGCRQLLCKDHPGPFLVGRGHGWEYFQNALSVQTELLYARNNFMAVQALAVMALFAESISSPALDYMLNLNAMKIAESRGLHRKPAAAWNLTESALQTRSYNWWSIYGHERSNASRWGRPLVISPKPPLAPSSSSSLTYEQSIDDAVITCPLPSKVVAGSMVNLDFVIPWIKHAQVSGHITQQITALKASTPSLDDVIRTISELEHTLREWHDSLPPVFRIETNLSDIPQDLDIVHVLYMHYAFFGGLITINSLLAHPWNSEVVRLRQSDTAELETHVAQSLQTVVGASRQIIHRLRHVNIDACSPRWLVFISPLTAFMNLFFYIIQYPMLATVESDLDCLYRVCGHFNYQEFMSPGIKLTFPREVTNLARSAITRANSDTRFRISLDVTGHVSPATAVRVLSPQNATVSNIYDPSLIEILNLDNENWGTLVSWQSGDEVAVMAPSLQDYRSSDMAEGVDFT
ncbi:hypothetical protein B0A52_07751 [Exophiala mesophila]|uniref:Xylanolytic transcriptional activator regulatory domain-containing protein n=1 Tax=Exophiala mesophila TaxID=212818 RepID=A0A438MVN2_EXOME|nr:hypothetical protein B0A52_07751 [Exophiala mesophila]